jgi:hypothetical protein
MRPNPTQPHDSDSGRIIYLGDVRRKRTSRRRQAPDRHSPVVLCIIAAAAWAVWLTVFLTLPPARLLTYLAFFTPLFVAVAATGAVLAYAVEWQRGYYPSLTVCLRRGALLAAVVVSNLSFLAAHRWVLPVVVVSVVAAVLVDIGVASRVGR